MNSLILRVFFCLTLVSLPFSVHAQHGDDFPGCGSDHLHEHLLDRNPEYRRQFQESNQRAERVAISQRMAGGKRTSTGTLTIPVVVHIIHNGGAENISDAQVLAGIQHLNQAFNKQPPYLGTGVNVEIEFCLAQRDPNGAPTSGINRVASPLTNLNMDTQDLALKSLSRWDQTQYLNIWLVGSICSNSGSCSVAGYAYLAGAHGQLYDGVVMEANFFGSSPKNSVVTIHEVGHYLNLRHTFNGGCPNNNCLTQGDYVCDTPPDNSTAYVSCGSYVNTCDTDADDTSPNNPFRPITGGGLGDQTDYYSDFMDYGNWNCQVDFTEGQRTRMRAALEGTRSSLLTSQGCVSACPSPPVASFTFAPGAPITGETITFTNTTTGGATTYRWYVDDVQKSTAPNFSQALTVSGSHTIRLYASSGPGCWDDTTVTINVNCPSTTSAFTFLPAIPLVDQAVTFTNTSTGAVNYNWLINGVSAGTTTNLGHTFTAPGTYSVKLAAQGGTNFCTDTSQQYVVVTCPLAVGFSFLPATPIAGQTVTFTNTSTGASNYQWFVNGTPISTATNPTYAFPSAGTYSVKLTGTAGACTESTTQTVQVVCPTIADFSASDLTPAAGQLVTFTNSSTSAASYEWFVNGTPFSTAMSPGYTFTAPGTYTVRLEASSGFSGCQKSRELTIMVSCPVVADFTMSDTIIDIGNPATFTNASLNATTYEWRVNGLPAAVSLNHSQVFPTAGNTGITLVSMGPYCSDSITKTLVVLDSCADPQNHNRNWRFANGLGIDFNTPTPSLITGASNNAYETSSTISDRKGNMVFYTDGRFVWDRTGAVMPNGSGLNGHESANQGALILPQPGSDSLYYVFHMWEFANPIGLSYSVVDMSLRGGLGDVTATKNIFIEGPVTEQLSATLHANREDWWVVTHDWGNNQFHAYLLDSTGLNLTPVVSAIGNVFNDNSVSSVSGSEQAVTIKFNHAGDKLASCTRKNKRVELFDFDNATGVISNQINLTGAVDIFYDSEFSPDDTRLYAVDLIQRDIWQYDLTAGSPASINASATRIVDLSSTFFNYFGELYLGPDGRIYCNQYQTNQLLVINNPNALGVACNPVQNGFSLGGGTGQISLQNLPKVFPDPDPKIEGPILLCADSVAEYRSNVGGQWIVSGPAVIASSGSHKATLTFTGGGTVELIQWAGCGKGDTISITVLDLPEPDLGPDTLYCAADFPSNLDPGTFDTYRWQDNSTAPTLATSGPGTYWVEVGNSLGCSATDTLNLEEDTALPTQVLEDTLFCAPASLLLLPDQDSSYTYSWQDGATDTSHVAGASGIYWVDITGRCGAVRDSAEVTFFTYPALSITGAPAYLCPDEMATIPLIATPSGGLLSGPSVIGSNLVPTLFTPQRDTIWYHIGYPEGCVDSAFVIVEDGGQPEPDLGKDSTYCPADLPLLLAPGSFASYTWDNTSGAPTRSAGSAGTYWVEVSNTLGCIGSDTVVIAVDLTPAPVPQLNDTTICEGDLAQLIPEQNSAFTYLWRDGSTEPKNTAFLGGLYWVDISTRCDVVRDQMTLTVLPAPPVDFTGLDSLVPCDTFLVNQLIPTPGGGVFSGEGLVGLDQYDPSQFSPPIDTVNYQMVYGNGCDASVTRVVLWQPCCEIGIPSAFSPNEDGLNDVFGYLGQIEHATLTIYNRWGEAIFSTQSIHEPWDGTHRGEPSPVGVYSYVLTYQCEFRLGEKDNVRQVGQVTLLR